MAINNEEIDLFLDCLGIVALVGYGEETKNVVYMNSITYWQDNHLGMAYVHRRRKELEIITSISSKTMVERTSLWYAIATNNVKRLKYIVRHISKDMLDKQYYNYIPASSESKKSSTTDTTNDVNGSASTSTVHASNSPLPPATVIKRLLRQIQEVHDCGWPHYDVFDYPPVSCTEIDFMVMGPPYTPYAGGIFDFTIKIPSDFPFRAPKIRCNTSMYHPDVTTFVHSCFLYQSNWTPSYSLQTIMLLIHSLFDLSSLELNKELACETVNPKAAKMFFENRTEFTKHAARMTRLYAQPSRLLREELSTFLFPRGSPFLFAVFKGYVHQARTLLEEGVDMHAVDFYGNNALVISITNYDTDMVKLLIEYKFPVHTTRSAGGETVFDILSDLPYTLEDDPDVTNRRVEILALLEKYASNPEPTNNLTDGGRSIDCLGSGTTGIGTDSSHILPNSNV